MGKRWRDEDKERLRRYKREHLPVAEIADRLDRSPKEIQKQWEKLREEEYGNLSAGVFFIGLAMLFLTKFSFFPGILFVFAAVALVDAAIKEKPREGIQAAIWLGGIGAMFTIGFQWQFWLLLIGGSMIFGTLFKSGKGSSDKGAAAAESEKQKNEWRLANNSSDADVDEDNDDYASKPKRGVMRLGPDGELIGIDEDMPYRETRRRNE
ncbi:MAG TPA: hypothetical protein PLD47_18375 [Aggregatilineales bacterium]|nr:hypothetical protein [Anaerolineales bacterium]HRE49695.1 hypothetical protein [Aggregatilineales bacterium]